MTIRPLHNRDIERVSQIHFEELPDDFCSLLGKNFLFRVFYPELFHASLIKLGAVDESDTVQGFIFFSMDETFFRRMITSHFFKILKNINWKIFFNLNFYHTVFEIIILIFTHDNQLKGAEEVYLAVSRKHQGKWLWMKLFEEGFSELSKKGITDCWLKTLASTPNNVFLYEKVGFKHLKTYLGRVYMIKEISQSPIDKA